MCVVAEWENGTMFDLDYIPLLLLRQVKVYRNLGIWALVIRKSVLGIIFAVKVLIRDPIQKLISGFIVCHLKKVHS